MAEHDCIFASLIAGLTQTKKPGAEPKFAKYSNWYIPTPIARSPKVPGMRPKSVYGSRSITPPQHCPTIHVLVSSMTLKVSARMSTVKQVVPKLARSSPWLFAKRGSAYGIPVSIKLPPIPLPYTPIERK